MDDKEGGGTAGIGRSHDWADMTEECLISILSRLSLEDRWRGPILACKSWLRACKDPCLNSVFNLETYFEPFADLPRYWTPEFERRIDSMLRSVVVWSDGSLSEIRVRHCSDPVISLVAERCPNLQVLSIKSSPHATDGIMAKIASSCSNLKELDISYCYEISHQSLALIGRLCPNLQILRRNLMNWLDSSPHVGIVPSDYLDACPQDGNSEAAAIGKFMPNLVHLELQFSKLTSKGLLLVSEGCPNLEYLDLSGCANVTGWDIATASSNLKKLITIKTPKFYDGRFYDERLMRRRWRRFA